MNVFDDQHITIIEKEISDSVMQRARPIVVFDEFEVDVITKFLADDKRAHGEVVQSVIPCAITTLPLQIDKRDSSPCPKNLTVPEILTRQAIFYTERVTGQFLQMLHEEMRNVIITISSVAFPDTLDVPLDHPLNKAIQALRETIQVMQSVGIDIVVAEGNFPTLDSTRYYRNSISPFRPARAFNVFTGIPEVIHVGGVQVVQEEGAQTFYLTGLPEHVDLWAFNTILSTKGNHTGNSFATPKLASAVSILYGAFPELGNVPHPARKHTIESILKQASTTLPVATGYSDHTMIDDICGSYAPRTYHDVQVFDPSALTRLIAS